MIEIYTESVAVEPVETNDIYAEFRLTLGSLLHEDEASGIPLSMDRLRQLRYQAICGAFADESNLPDEDTALNKYGKAVSKLLEFKPTLPSRRVRQEGAAVALVGSQVKEPVVTQARSWRKPEITRGNAEGRLITAAHKAGRALVPGTVVNE
jgi:hypothetical protein